MRQRDLKRLKAMLADLTLSQRRELMAAMPRHKVGFFFSQAGLKRRLEELGGLIEEDLRNVDGFVLRWLVDNQPILTDGNVNVIRGSV